MSKRWATRDPGDEGIRIWPAESNPFFTHEDGYAHWTCSPFRIPEYLHDAVFPAAKKITSGERYRVEIDIKIVS